MDSAQRPSAAPALVVPFRLRGACGEVRIHYGPNLDPVRWGFDLLELPFPAGHAQGFPVFLAEVVYGGSGYRSLMGWSQLLRVTPHDGSPPWTGFDRAATEVASTAPASFTYLPSLFDAPGPNPPRNDERWQAESWLLACPTVARACHAEAVAGVGWGYDRTPAGVRLLPPAALTREDWARALPFYREAYPSWRFEPVMHAER